MKNFKKKTNYFFITLLIISYFTSPFIEIPFKISPNIATNQINLNSVLYQIENTDNSITIRKWEDLILRYDKNRNDINDILDNKLVFMEKSDSSNQIDFIAQFPESYDYASVIMILKNYEGKIKYTYKDAINGFAGQIDSDNFNDFCSELRRNNIQFFIEEDSKVKANLYYTSRNLNLRPYVWKELNGGYTGDNTSSIAILDTGIDVSHEFFDNFSNGNFQYKIVNWTDFTIGGDNNTVHDDGAHGSHVAGIAAGMGTPILDENGRIVSTYTYFYNLTGIDISADIAYGLPLTIFNAPSAGQIKIECNFTDYTPAPDRTQGWAWLFRGEDLVASLNPTSNNWEDNLTYTISTGYEGIYELWAVYYMDDGNGDGWVSNSSARFRAEVHWPFEPSTYDCGNRWQGVAPNTHLVGVKVLTGNGTGDVSWLIKGVDYVIKNRRIYNITIMSMSLGIEPHYFSNPSLIDAVNNAVENGIVTIVSAGNDRAGGNNTACPGDADNVITVAAMNYIDQVTEYSSQGGGSYTGNTIKPDIVAPGGSLNYFQMFSADTNENDGEKYPIDNYLNDLMPAEGTSMAAPAVAGAASLLIEAMGGGNNWDWNSGNKPKLVKAILLMTATETYPLEREYDTSYSPSLNRGGKDVHEGYGRLNIDAAIEAWTNNLTDIENINPILYASIENSYGNHAYAGYVNLKAGQTYLFNLTVSSGKDYDLYLYNYTADKYGEPDLIASSISSIPGQDEQINFTAKYDGKYFLVAKAIGIPIPSEDNGDGNDEEEIFNLLEFLLSPLGLLIIGTVAAIIIIMVLTFRAMRRSKVNERERIKSIVNKSYS